MKFKSKRYLRVRFQCKFCSGKGVVELPLNQSIPCEMCLGRGWSYDVASQLIDPTWIKEVIENATEQTPA